MFFLPLLFVRPLHGSVLQSRGSDLTAYSLYLVLRKWQNEVPKYWEIIADNLKKAGWSHGYVAAVDCEGRTIWIVDAHRGDGQLFIVRADEILTAFLELESQLVVKGTLSRKGPRFEPVAGCTTKVL